MSRLSDADPGTGRGGAVAYDQSYYLPWCSGLHGIELTRRSKARTFDAWVRLLERFVPPGRLLDIGCAMGFFLEAAEKRGWIGYGIEISEFSAGKASETFGDRIFCGDLCRQPFAAIEFAAVSMLDVLEHLEDPSAALAQAAGLLKPGGCLLLNTPDSQSTSARWLGAWWPQRKDEHLFLYSRRALYRLLRRAGFEVIQDGPARKWVTLEFLFSYLHRYSANRCGDLLATLAEMLPAWVLTSAVPLCGGEVLIVARRV